MKEFKIYWDETIIYHRVATVEAKSKKEAIRMVKCLQVNGDPDPNQGDDFGKIINSSIKVEKEN